MTGKTWMVHELLPQSNVLCTVKYILGTRQGTRNLNQIIWIIIFGTCMGHEKVIN